MVLTLFLGVFPVGSTLFSQATDKELWSSKKRPWGILSKEKPEGKQMRQVILGAIAFWLAPVIPIFLILSGSGVVSDNWVLLVIPLFYYFTFSTVGFLIPTARSRLWRRLTPIKVILIAGALGLTHFVFYFVGFGFVGMWLFQFLFRSLWLAFFLSCAMLGIFQGLIGILIARGVQRSR